MPRPPETASARRTSRGCIPRSSAVRHEISLETGHPFGKNEPPALSAPVASKARRGSWRFPSSMPVAFKEWAVTVRALAEGEQLLTLRKGGIREENKHFELEHERFFLYPTFDHQHNNLVRESHHPAARPGSAACLGRGDRPHHGHRSPHRRRPLPLLRLDPRLCRKAAALEAPSSPPRPAAAGPPHSPAGHGPG